MDVALARAIDAGTEAIHEADPEAVTAIEGAQIPGWGGYDYSRLGVASMQWRATEIEFADAADLLHNLLCRLLTRPGFRPISLLQCLRWARNPPFLNSPDLSHRR